jgi:zinc protease
MSERKYPRIKVLWTILIFSTCIAQTRPPARPASTRPGAPFLQSVKTYEETPNVTRVVLKNGMTVLVDEFRIQPVVSIQLYVRAGSFDDPPQSPGMARLVGAIVLRGPADKSSGTYRQKTQALGGNIKSKTDYSATLFESIAPSNQWKKALDDQAEAILNPSFDNDSLRLEARLARSEARGNLDEPEAFVREKLVELAFNQPRMGRRDILSSSALENLSPESLTGFYRTLYTPPRMLMVVSGDISSNEVLNEVVRLYAKPAGAVPKPASFPFSASQDEFRYRSIQGNTPVPSLSFGFHTVSENDEDARALEIVASMLGFGEASILSSRLKNRKKLILSAETELLTYAQFGYLSIHAKVNPAYLDRSEIGIMTEIELLKREEPTEAEMERARALIERAYWSGLETVSGRADTLAHFEFLGDWKRMNRRIAELRKVKPSDVKRVSEKYLRLENCSLVEYLPPSLEPRPQSAENARRTFDSLLAASTDEEQAERNRQTVLAVKVPAHHDGFKFNEIRFPFQTASILRGPELFIREEHSNPLIEMGLFFPAGKLEEKKENAGITELMTRLILKGSADSNQLYRQLEVYGGLIRPVVTDDYFGFYLSVLSQNFAEAFQLLLQAMQAPNFEIEEINRQKEIQAAELLSRKSSLAYPSSLMNQALFENFSYAQDSAGTAASIEAITPDALIAWYNTHVKNRKPVVALIGDTKGTSIASLFVQHFSGSRIQDTKIPEDFSKPLEKGKLVEQKWDRSESLILVGFQAPPEDDEDGYAVAVFQGYLGGPGRLVQELRDRLGIAHSVSVTYKPRLRGGSLIIGVSANSENGESAVKALKEEIQRVRQSPILYRDFRSAVNESIGDYTIGQQLRAKQIFGIAENVLAGKGLEGYQNHTEGLKEVREEDLRSAIQKFVNPDHAVFLTIHAKRQ